MKIQTSPNRTARNKRDPDNPFVATLNGDFIAVGTTAPEAKDRAISALYDAWTHRDDRPITAIAADGSLFIGFYTGQDTVGLEHHDIDTAACSLRWRCGYSAMLHKDHTAADSSTFQFNSVADAVKYHVTAWNKQLAEHPAFPAPANT